MLHTEAIAAETLGLLRSLCAKPYLANHALVGVTALALQYGHRLSIDLDLFSYEPLDAMELRELLEGDYEKVIILRQREKALNLTINDIKVDILPFKYKLLFPLIQKDGVRMLDKRDIAAMKLDTVSRRCTKKDFFDIYRLLNDYTLSEMTDWYGKKFQEDTIFYIIRSLNYFEPAETTADPESLDGTKWTDVKSKLIEEVRSYQF